MHARADCGGDLLERGERLVAFCLAGKVVRERVERSEPICIRVDGRGYIGDFVLMKLLGVEIERLPLLVQRPDDASTIDQLEKARIQIDRDAVLHCEHLSKRKNRTSCSRFAIVSMIHRFHSCGDRLAQMRTNGKMQVDESTSVRAVFKPMRDNRDPAVFGAIFWQ